MLWAQSLYTLVTALWALIDIDSFMAVTGPKTDIWLVKTVAVILIPISFCLISACFVHTNLLPIAVLSITLATGLIIIEIYYTGRGTISKIYLADTVMQSGFIAAWAMIW